MALCSDCGMLFGIEGLRYGDILLKEDLAELIASAEDGCRFCQMCWASFQEQCEQEMIENHLRLLPDELLRDSDVKIHVSMRFDELRYNDDKELCDSRTFSNCRLAISTGPINAAPDDYTLQLKLEAELSVFADPGKQGSTQIPRRCMYRGEGLQLTRIHRHACRGVHTGQTLHIAGGSCSCYILDQKMPVGMQCLSQRLCTS